MLNEVKTLFNNIKRFRLLLTEAVNDSDMAKYIQNHEYVYIYYTGDETNQKGYRTIRPYVLGVSTAGNKVIRAWQDNKKNSVTFDNRPTRTDSLEHDYWNDNEGVKPGWRMFSLDKISKAYPIGKKFNNPDGTVMIPPKYNEGADGGMSSIIAYVSSKNEPDFQPKEVQPQQQAGEKRTKWDNFTRGNKNNRRILADDVIKLRDIASRVYKKKQGSFLVVINNNNEFDIIDVKDKDKVPENAIVGSLPNLYDTLIRKNASVEDNFFNQNREKAKNQRTADNKNTENGESPSIPFEKKPFFKQ